MTTLHAVPRGYERSVLIKRGSTVVAEVFTDREPGDQYKTSAVFAAAPDLLAALELCRARLRSASYKDDATTYALERASAAITRATGA